MVGAIRLERCADEGWKTRAASSEYADHTLAVATGDQRYDGRVGGIRQQPGRRRHEVEHRVAVNDTDGRLAVAVEARDPHGLIFHGGECAGDVEFQKACAGLSGRHMQPVLVIHPEIGHLAWRDSLLLAVDSELQRAIQ